jgi:hypothetical protein
MHVLQAKDLTPLNLYSTDLVDVVRNGASIHGYGPSALANAINGSSRSGSRTPAGDDWELDCEICLKHGINLVTPLTIVCYTSSMLIEKISL